jgi:peptidoglycan/LPS O-acetylase OafA/YrhL
MEPGEAPRVPSMDGFRSLAILWIFLLHAWVDSGRAPMDHGIFRTFFSEGYIGLDILFVLSGFVIYLPAALNKGNMGSVRAYTLRRFARLAPAYYFSLAIALSLHRWIAPGFAVAQPWTSLVALKAFVYHLLFLQTYTQSATAPLGFGVLPVIWTLTLEATFYALLPLIARPFYRRPFLWLAGALIGAEIWQWAIVPGGFSATTVPSMLIIRLVGSFPTYAGHFALGMTAAWLFARYKGAAASPRGRLVVVGMQLASAGAIVGFVVHRSAASLATRFYIVERMDTGAIAMLLALFMLATTLAPRWFQWPFANRLLAGLGDTSYGVYLTHFMLLGIATTLLGVHGDGSNAGLAEIIFFTLPPALALGWLSCRFLEQPARLWARRIVWRSRSSAPALGLHETYGQGQQGHGIHREPHGDRGDHQHDEHAARAG